MITYSTLPPQNVDRTKPDRSRVLAKPEASLESRHLWFFFGVAPLAVLIGWLTVAICLTGDWAWELPIGLMLSIVGSMTAMAGTRLR